MLECRTHAMCSRGNIIYVIVYLVYFSSFVLGFEKPYLTNETGKYVYYSENHNSFFLCYYCPKTAFRSDADAEIMQDENCISKTSFTSLDPEEKQNHWYPYCKKGGVPSCENLPQVQNGNLGQIIGFTGFSVYSKWRLICNNGYRIKQGIPEIYRCSEERKWSTNFNVLLSEVCIPEVCLPLTEGKNGTWNCDHTQRPVPVGGTCHFICDKGFRSITNSSVVCDNDLKWKGTNSTPPLCEKTLDTPVLEKPNNQPYTVYIISAVIILSVLIGAFVLFFVCCRRKHSETIIKDQSESNSDCIEMQDCSKMCSDANFADTCTTKTYSLCQENEKENKKVRDNKKKEAKIKTQPTYQRGKTVKTKHTATGTTFFKFINVNNDKEENIKAEQDVSITSIVSDDKTENLALYREEADKKTEEIALNDATDCDGNYSEEENKNADKCIISISDALDDRKFNGFFKDICKIFDAKDEWSGLVKAELPDINQYTIECIGKHRKGDPEDGYTKYVIHNHFKTQNKTLGHILNYVDKKFKALEDKEYTLKLFKKCHMDCQFCSDIYIKYS